MKVIKAKTAGFCFGVKRAVDTVYKQVDTKCGQIYTYGPIIHNEEVIKDMRDKGVIVLRSEEDLDMISQGFAYFVPAWLFVRLLICTDIANSYGAGFRLCVV